MKSGKARRSASLLRSETFKPAAGCRIISSLIIDRSRNMIRRFQLRQFSLWFKKINWTSSHESLAEDQHGPFQVNTKPYPHLHSVNVPTPDQQGNPQNRNAADSYPGRLAENPTALLQETWQNRFCNTERILCYLCLRPSTDPGKCLCVASQFPSVMSCGVRACLKQVLHHSVSEGAPTALTSSLLSSFLVFSVSCCLGSPGLPARSLDRSFAKGSQDINQYLDIR